MDLNKEASMRTHSSGTSAQGTNAPAAQQATLVPEQGNPENTNAANLAPALSEQVISATPITASNMVERLAATSSVLERIERPTSPVSVFRRIQEPTDLRHVLGNTVDLRQTLAARPDATREQQTRADNSDEQEPQLDPTRLLGALMRRFDEQEERARATNARLDSLFASRGPLPERTEGAHRRATFESPTARASSSPSIFERLGHTADLRHTIAARQGTVPERETPQTQHSELEDMRNQLREMSSRMHQALSSAPEIDRVLAETQRTPFSARITSIPIRNTAKLRLQPYSGDSDPKQHLTAFSIAMGRVHFSPEEYDSGHCQYFIEYLAGPALDWFTRLESRSIDSFQQLSMAFLRHYAIYIEDGASDADLWGLVQGEKETLEKFMDRFKAVISRVTVSDTTAVAALKQGLRSSKFRKEMILHPLKTIEEAMHRSLDFIRLEKDQAGQAQKNSPVKPHASRAKAKEVVEEPYQEPRQHFNHEYKKNLTTNVVNTSSSLPPRQWNKYQRPQEVQEPASGQSYCDYHQMPGHSTAQCRQLKEQLLAQYQKGAVKVVPPIERGEKRKSEEEHHEHEQKSSGNANSPTPPKRAQSDKGQADKKSSTIRVLMIMGGLSLAHDSVRSLKQYEKEAITEGSCPDQTKVDMPIIFTEADTKNLAMPHNDPLVVELKIEDCEVTRVLIDTGSSVDLIFKETLEKMQIPGSRIKPGVRPLTGFDGVTTMTVGSIKLMVHAGGISRNVKFMVVDKPAVYNVIMGTPWLFSLRAVSSTYHQCLKFPTPHGVFTIRGNQKMARTCFIAGKQLRSVNFCVSSQEETDSTSSELTRQVICSSRD